MNTSHMTRMKRRAVKALSCLLALSPCACGQEEAAVPAESGGYLRVGVKSYIVNFSYYNPKSDSYFGLEIDLAEELAIKMGCSGVTFVPVTQDNCEDKLTDGDIDVLISCYSQSEYRGQYFDFSPVYYVDSGKIMVASSSLYEGVGDLLNKTIGVNHGSSSWHLFGTMMMQDGYIPSDDDDTIEEYFTVVKYDDIDALFQDLETGKIDAVLADEAILKTYYEADKYTILDESYSTEEYAAACVKGSALSQSIYDAMAELIEDGTVDKLIAKWN